MEIIVSNAHLFINLYNNFFITIQYKTISIINNMDNYSHIINKFNIHEGLLPTKLVVSPDSGRNSESKIQNFLPHDPIIDRPTELLELINDCLKPKSLEKKEFGEVFTPINFINDCMLKDIEDYWFKKYNENIWTNELLKWYDPAAGMGNYPIAIFYKLLEGLKNKIPDYELRKKHILEKQLFMGELNKKNCHLIKQLFNIDNKYKLNLYEGDTLKINIFKEFNINKFDIIIGNPPYNEQFNDNNNAASPLYHTFIEFYLNKCSILSFIVPNKWFTTGKGLDKFRNMMINRTDIVFIKPFYDARKIFRNTVSIEGGVNYFLIDDTYNGLCDFNGTMVKFNNFDIILDGKFFNIVQKLLNYPKITQLYMSQGYFNVQTNDIRLKTIDDISSNVKDYVKCYVSQQKGFVKYIHKKDLKKGYNFYKVITAEANGGKRCFGNIFIGNTDEVNTGSYIAFKVNSKNEADSLLSYLKCRLPNFLLSLRKISQHISESTCKWIPLPPLNVLWTDDKVYKYFKLSRDDITLINCTNIKGYNNIQSNNKFIINNISNLIHNDITNLTSNNFYNCLNKLTTNLYNHVILTDIHSNNQSIITTTKPTINDDNIEIDLNAPKKKRIRKKPTIPSQINDNNIATDF